MSNLEEIYRNNYILVYKFLLAKTSDENLAEELTQETFYRAVKNINKFNGKCKISTWLCTIAKNLWIDEVKRRNKIQPIEETEKINSSTNEIFENDDKLFLFKEIQKLDVNTREIIYLRLSGELSFKEIAIIMGKNENWARVTFYRGKKKLMEVRENERKSKL